MRGTKRCFLCGENHSARLTLGRRETCNVIEQLKEKHLTALLIVEDPVTVYKTDEFDNGTVKQQENDDYVQWAQTERDNVVMLAFMKAKAIQEHFSMSGFLHRTGLNYDNHINTCRGYNSFGAAEIIFDG